MRSPLLSDALLRRRPDVYHGVRTYRTRRDTKAAEPMQHAGVIEGSDLGVAKCLAIAAESPGVAIFD